jgi:hypothetical protein
LRCQRLLFEPRSDEPLEQDAASFVDPSMQRQTGQEDQQDLSVNEQHLLSVALDVRKILVTSQKDDAILHQRLDGIKPTGVTSG